MSLVHDILKGISDDRRVTTHLPKGTPLWVLIESYNKVALNDDNLPSILSSTTGAELKDAIGLMVPEMQVAILHKYSQSTKLLDVNNPVVMSDEDNIKLEERRFRLYVAKAMVSAFFILMLVIVGAVIALSVAKGELANEGLIETIMTTAAEIIKLIFAVPK